MIRLNSWKLILRCTLLVILGLCLVILSSLFSGIFPYYENTRTIFLILSALLTISLTVTFIVDLTRNTLNRERIFFLILFSIIILVPIIEYNYLVRKQDVLIETAISTIEHSVGSYDLLSELPNNEAITILENSRVTKNLCAVSYFFGVFYLCVNQTDRTVVFMIDITPAPSGNQAIRVSTRRAEP